MMGERQDRSTHEVLATRWVRDEDWCAWGEVDIRYPSGTVCKGLFRYVDRGGGVAIVPVDAQGNLVLVRHYRDTLGGYSVEIPRGKRHMGESPEAAAERETAEELGCSTLSVERMGVVAPDDGFVCNVVPLVLVRVTGKMRANEDEGITQMLVLSLDDVLDLIKDGEIVDSFTQAAALRMLMREA